MNDITPPVPLGRQLIQGYGGGGFRVGGEARTGSVIVRPDKTVSWPVSSFEELSVSSLGDLLIADGGIEVLLIGCGPRMGMPRPDIRDALKEFSIVPEWMDTGAACRTFNVLLSEDRAVAAALIAVE
jgi:uncharacterized protein